MSYRLGVVGSPIVHSLTPRLHRAALDHWDLVGSSEAIDVGISQVADVAQLMESFYGLSVTMPLKELVVSLCESLDETAQRVGAVNSLCKQNGTLIGRNFDGQGFVDALRTDMGMDVRDRICIVRGSGGSAKSIVDALVSAQASHVALIARNRPMAERIQRNYGAITVNPDSLDDVALIVNTVPYVQGAAVELSEPRIAWSDDAVAIDVVYYPQQTPWLNEHHLAHRRTGNGLAMLVHQARHQLEWWFQREIDASVLFSALTQ